MSEFAVNDVVWLKPSDPAMIVKGQVKSRSSSAASQGGPPGESKIHELNPQREMEILKATGWQSLEPGSLNLCVDDEKAGRLVEVKELIFEPPDKINYPEGWQHIPNCRGGYKYYLSTARVREKTQDVLVRRAINPVQGCIELFAAVNLRRYFKLQDDDEIQVTVISCK